MPISDELKAVYATAPTEDYYVETLELRHPQFDNGKIYITNQLQGWRGYLENAQYVEFRFLPFAVLPPKSEEGGNYTLQVAIDNADRQLMEQLEKLAKAPTEPIVLLFRVYLASDPATVQNNPPLQLSILSVMATQSTIAFNAGLADLRQRPYPSMLYTVDRYPGLAR